VAAMLARTRTVIAPAPARSMNSPVRPGMTIPPTLSPSMITALTPAVSRIDCTARVYPLGQIGGLTYGIGFSVASFAIDYGSIPQAKDSGLPNVTKLTLGYRF